MKKIVTYGIGGFDPTKPNNNVIEEVEIDEPQQPLDQLGAAMTLFVIQGLLTIEDAANAINLSPQDLVNEARAWYVASQQLGS